MRIHAVAIIELNLNFGYIYSKYKSNVTFRETVWKKGTILMVFYECKYV